MSQPADTRVQILILDHGEDEDVAISGLMYLLADESGIEMIEPRLTAPGYPVFDQTAPIVIALTSAGLLKRLGAVLARWLGVGVDRVIKVTIDGQTIELRHGSVDQYDRLVDAYIARLADKSASDVGLRHPGAVDRPSRTDRHKRRSHD
jgi:hypothetical protein